MSDQSDSQNAFNEVFMIESDPSSPSIDQAYESDPSPVGRTRLLADIPPTVDREKELRSKFLNDPATPEEQNLTLKYLNASQSGDKQTLRELRHQILARRTRRHPPTDAVPGLDVLPLREHAWLDSLADAGVRVSSDFYDRLQECTTPNPPIVDLGDDSASPAMAQEDNTEVVYQRRTGVAASKAPMVEESSRSGREGDDEVGPGTNAVWLPEDACNGPLSVVIDESWRREALELHYPRVARDLYHMPAPYRLIVPSEGSIITDCPPGHVAVYTHHFEFGLRFPLDSFLVEILNAFNVCLAQLTPLAVRNLIAYIWVIRFLDFPPTLNLFRHLHWLKKNGSSRLAGWWSLMTADKKMTVQPKMTSLKGWQDAFFWVRVPDDSLYAAILLNLLRIWST
ncbi:uncharacterized protein LOC130589645 [Beta vulgaris subsp. vulgaris]|uniref:uncharacterized protein LOC130589645 n=1 Tax=Beta vulgaris subsp. vulgaris TaxID=3555 RepID=UPI002547AB90|nr:uncharacterized protein LOC130589645 [Beta vulgaris subsp. vulgaris]